MDERTSSLVVFEDEHVAVQSEQTATIPEAALAPQEAVRPTRPASPRVREDATSQRPVLTFVMRMLRFFFAIALTYLAADTWGALAFHQASALFALIPLSLATSLVVSSWLTALVFYDRGGAGATAP
jgi:hypothetical protein